MFASPLTDEQKQKLDRLCKRDSLHWTKETEPRLCYEYFDDAWGERGGVYTIHCSWGLMLGIVAVEGAINKRRRQMDS